MATASFAVLFHEQARVSIGDSDTVYAEVGNEFVKVDLAWSAVRQR